MMYFYPEDYQQTPWKGDRLRLEVFYIGSGGYITTHGVKRRGLNANFHVVNVSRLIP